MAVRNHCHDKGRLGTHPAVLIKIIIIQYLFGLPSLCQPYYKIQVNLVYHWFLGYGLLDEIPHFTAVRYPLRKEKRQI